jgi:hypothetical protein
MNAETFAEWLRRQGYRVIRTPSSYWYEAGSRVYQAFPYHWLIEPTEGELRGLLLKSNAIALRYSAPMSHPRGKVSYHMVCEDAIYDLPSLSRQARQNVRRGLEYARVEPIPMSRLASEGWTLRRETLERQGRTDAESEDWWRRLCVAAEDLPGFEAWGAIHDSELAASFLAFRCDDWYTLPYQQSASAHQEYRVNNAIFYSVVHEALERDGVSKVFMGLHSLDAPSTVDQFKLRMGFTARPVRQRVVFHPLVALFVNGISHAAVKRMLDRSPQNSMLAKAEGMIRFYLDGKHPPSEQEWPECLAEHKNEWLNAGQTGARV